MLVCNSRGGVLRGNSRRIKTPVAYYPVNLPSRLRTGNKIWTIPRWNVSLYFSAASLSVTRKDLCQNLVGFASAKKYSRWEEVLTGPIVFFDLTSSARILFWTCGRVVILCVIPRIISEIAHRLCVCSLAGGVDGFSPFHHPCDGLPTQQMKETSLLTSKVLPPSTLRSWINACVVNGQSLAVVGSFFYVPYIIIYLQRKLKTTRQRALAMFSLIMLLLCPIKKSSWVQRLFVWDEYDRYFQTKVVGPAFSSQQTVFGIYPHGIVPLTLGLTAFGQLNILFNELRIAVATATRLVPVFSHVLRLGGAVDASASSVNETLLAGHSVGLTPGGIAEMFYGYPQPGCHPDEEYAVLHSRKGFIRFAIKYGCQIVPVFVFGGSKLYRRVVMPQFIVDLSRRWQTSLLLFYGKYGLPIPFQIPMTYAVGKAIRTVINVEPTVEEVDFVHNIFVASLLSTFDSHKNEYGWGHKRLIII